MPKLTFTKDASGAPRARAPKRHALLARYLESDLQGSDRAAARVLKALRDVASGKRKRWSETGNAHTLTLSRDGARIESELDEAAEPYELPLGELQESLDAWHRHVSEPAARRPPSAPASPASRRGRR